VPLKEPDGQSENQVQPTLGLLSYWDAKRRLEHIQFGLRRYDERVSMILELLSKTRAVHWIMMAAAILLVDYSTGPFVQFPILFVIPVALATATHGRGGGIGVAAVLPLLRLSFFLRWPLQSSWILEGIDTAVDIAILIGFSFLIDRILQQQRAIRILQGLLPICGFCKKIRNENGEWRQLESFITERSNARFSHTFCQECGRQHYAEMMD
jgi:hypothetical protein